MMKENIKDYFISDSERIQLEDKEELIPQLYWGNLTNPELVVLGKNPSYGIDDELDNKYFSIQLKENLDINNHINNQNEGIINLLSNLSNIFSESNVSKFWRKYFSECNKFPEYRNDYMNKVAIFNIYGYYSKDESPYMPFVNKNLLNKSDINTYLEYVVAAIKNAKEIVIMWKGSIPAWEYLLNKFENGLFDKIKEKIYVANGSCNIVNVLHIDDNLKIKNFRWEKIE